MSTIWIKCPATGRRVSTGIEIEPEDFAGLPKAVSEVPCPACGLKHLWLREDAWLTERPPIVEPLRRAS